MQIVLIRDGNTLKPESGSLPENMPNRIEIEISDDANVESARKGKARRTTPRGRPILEQEEIADRECPHPYDPDL